MKVVTIPAVAAKQVKVHGCHDCPHAVYEPGMSDVRGHYCVKLKHMNHGWGFNVNIERMEKKFPKECPL